MPDLHNRIIEFVLEQNLQGVLKFGNQQPFWQHSCDVELDGFHVGVYAADMGDFDVVETNAKVPSKQNNYISMAFFI